jgi:hypothetical protein
MAPESYPVPPTAVRVWRGYRAPSLSLAAFLTDLGATFVPAAALMQPPVGLRAYVPGVFASDTLPDGVPQETALLSWDSPAAYAASFGTLAERVYTLTHGGVYDLTRSKATFPEPLAATVATEVAYTLLAEPADWMTGTAYQLLVSVPDGPGLEALAAWAGSYAASPPDGVQGAFLLAGAAYVSWWELWPSPSAADPAARAWLAALGDVVADTAAVPTTLTAALDDTWPGITVAPGDVLTFQLTRGGAP